jgi:hypothetical protein
MLHQNERGRPAGNRATSVHENSSSTDKDNLVWLYKQACKARDQRAFDLETVADWKDDLQKRIRRAELCFELIGFGQDEMEDLQAEAQRFREVCARLAEPRRAA